MKWLEHSGEAPMKVQNIGRPVSLVHFGAAVSLSKEPVKNFRSRLQIHFPGGRLVRGIGQRTKGPSEDGAPLWRHCS